MTNTYLNQVNFDLLQFEIFHLKKLCESFIGSSVSLDAKLLGIYSNEYVGKVECNVIDISLDSEQVYVEFVDPVQGGTVKETVKLKNILEGY